VTERVGKQSLHRNHRSNVPAASRSMCGRIWSRWP
jgi:hypothetical protein